MPGSDTAASLDRRRSVRPADHGFSWGPVDVTRLAYDQKYGFFVSVACHGGEVVVRVSPKGNSINVTEQQP